MLRRPCCFDSVPFPPDGLGALARHDRIAHTPGSGIVHAHAEHELARLAALVQAPVTTSWSGETVWWGKARCLLPSSRPAASGEFLVELGAALPLHRALCSSRSKP